MYPKAINQGARTILIAGALLVVLSVVLPALAAPDAPGYKLTWWTVDGGGRTRLANGGYVLAGTIGQPDAAMLSGASYGMTGGFWAGRGAWSLTYVFLPLVVRGS